MLIPILTAGFIYVQTTAINVDNIIALEPTKDGKQCLIHLITKNPFPVEMQCSAIADKIPSASSNLKPLLTGIAGLLLGGIAGLMLANKRRI